MNYFLYKLIPPRCPTLWSVRTRCLTETGPEGVAGRHPGTAVPTLSRECRPGHVARAGMGAHGEARNAVWLGVPAVVRYGAR